MDIMEKLSILTGAAKYDVACTSSGVDRAGVKGKIGTAVAGGICHSFAADGRCISLLKICMANYCVYDCKYCVNRVSNDVPRTALSPEELAGLTVAFYRRNYIEGLFLSSGVIKNPDYTTELMIRALEILRGEYRFNGYIHAKTIPGTSLPLITRLGLLADRLSVNIELPSEHSLNLLAPEKNRQAVLRPMGFIKNRIAETSSELALFRNAPRFSPAGHATQMIIGATPDTDFQIMRLAESIYGKYRLKRVFYSAYIPMGSHELLPIGQPPPLLREHRLYQTDWLLRFYGFKASEILDEEHQTLSLAVDPKCNWALNHLGEFPVEINSAEYETLLRVPGIGVTSAKRIVAARRTAKLNFADLKKLGIVLKRAVYFITCSGKNMYGFTLNEKAIYQNLVAGSRHETLKLGGSAASTQLSFLDEPPAPWPALNDEYARTLQMARITGDAGADARPEGASVNAWKKGAAANARPGDVTANAQREDENAQTLLPDIEDLRMSMTGQL